MSEPLNPPAHYRLSQLQQHLRRVIALNMKAPVWVRAEISSIDQRRHVYLSLVEQETGEKARAEAIIWEKDLRKLRKKMGERWDLVLQKGRQVLLSVLPELHEYYGLKLTVFDVFEEFTLGRIELERQQTQEWLQEQGLWNRNREHFLPAVVQRLAVISSPEAAGLQDFMQHIQQNEFGYAYRCELFPAAVQGEQARREIPLQLAAVGRRASEFDAVVLVRGGGSKLDLLEFDRREVCTAVAHCPLPLLCGIGHEIDRSLTDEVAYLSLKTPTAVAHFLLDRTAAFESLLLQKARRISQLIRQKQERQASFLQQLQYRLKSALQSQLSAENRRIERIEQRLAGLDPGRTLRQGYVLVFDENGQLLRSADDWQQSHRFRLRFHDGTSPLIDKIPD